MIVLVVVAAVLRSSNDDYYMPGCIWSSSTATAKSVSQSTKVRFAAITDPMTDEYLLTKESLDKIGAVSWLHSSNSNTVMLVMPGTTATAAQRRSSEPPTPKPKPNHRRPTVI